jgi:hypothetical protein
MTDNTNKSTESSKPGGIEPGSGEPTAPKGKTPSESEPASVTGGLQKKSNKAISSDNTIAVVVDAAAGKVYTNSRRVFGTNNKHSINALGNQLINVVLNTAGKHDLLNNEWVLPIIHGIGPKDQLEGLLAVQMVSVHSLAMEYLKRVSLENQTPYGIDANINRATKLLRTFTMQMEALNRHRGKVGQQMVVGNVNVNEGGQAVVGQVSHDGRGKAPTEDDADKVQ